MGAQALGPSPWLSSPTLAFIPLISPTSSTLSFSNWFHGLHYSNLGGDNQHWTDNQLLLLTDRVSKDSRPQPPVR